MNENQKKILIDLAYSSIENFLEHDEKISIDENTLESDFKEKRATFITLKKNGALRGCIGMLQAVKPLYQDIIDNALSAAFHDSRFMPLSKEEFKNLDVEISVLSPMKKLDYKDADDLLEKLDKKFGLLIKKGHHSATFLPQVWEELIKKEDFLSHLCMKAGMSHDEWKKGDIEIFIYEVEKFK
jgi:AmmeMemoRadiSam system protein A